MPKYKKGFKRTQDQIEEEQQRLLDLKAFMYSSSIKSLVIGAVCFIISLLFNGNIINLELEAGSYLDIIMIIVKCLSVILFFTFTIIGLANNMELRGDPASIREVIIIGILALIQTVRSGTVFGVSLLGVLLIVLYLWVIQPKVKSD